MRDVLGGLQPVLVPAARRVKGGAGGKRVGVVVRMEDEDGLQGSGLLRKRHKLKSGNRLSSETKYTIHETNEGNTKRGAGFCSDLLEARY